MEDALTERIVRTYQQGRLFDALYADAMLKKGEIDHLAFYFSHAAISYQNGLPGDEIALVKERVNEFVAEKLAQN